MTEMPRRLPHRSGKMPCISAVAQLLLTSCPITRSLRLKSVSLLRSGANTNQNLASSRGSAHGSAATQLIEDLAELPGAVLPPATRRRAPRPARSRAASARRGAAPACRSRSPRVTMCSPLASPTRCESTGISIPGCADRMISFSVSAVPEGASSFDVWCVSSIENLYPSSFASSAVSWKSFCTPIEKFVP